ncbi:MAG TPA: transferrin receptor-like dimerization domain-containing protein [Candidatus Saccharimonadales bacterium]|nr:transferrin receptor-like dimerization domain-containing protein [Candidatus Saccharimonadales bacterium]
MRPVVLALPLLLPLILSPLPTGVLRAAPAGAPAADLTEAPGAAGEPGAPLGYSTAAWRAQRDWEQRFRALPSADSVQEYARRLSARPHAVGSDADRDNAEWVAARLRAWGLDARLEEFYVLFPTPRERAVELVEPRAFTCRLQEPPVPGDSTSRQQQEQLPTYNAYSIDGDVTAPLVYVNYGVPDDYEQLDRLGISVRGAIVIARYGGGWRGVKPKLAAEHGAVGCLIYSDPREDGFFAGDPYPAGAYRPADGVQRGSVQDMSVQPGDPLTPGVAAAYNARRLPLAEARTLTKVPVLPLSWGDAQPLLAELRGPVAPEAWRGALPITYHVGPGPARVHLKAAFNWDLKPIRDVVARIPGGAAEDEWVIRGNHYDAWVNGTEDPVSGASALLEEARGLAELLRQGWRPRRTILLCWWDGEEPGLLGSTEWVEAHADELGEHAALYVNSDSNGRGYLEAGGSHTLERLVNEVAREVEDPEIQLTPDAARGLGLPSPRLSVGARARLRAIGQAHSPEERQEARRRPGWLIGALGSGSDYTAFLDHAGVASLNLGFGGESGGGVYHSIYDDPSWYARFGDPGFRYGRTLAQTAGSVVLRAADAELLPLDFRGLAGSVRRYVDELEKLLQKERDDAREHNREVAEGYFEATTDPTRPVPLPAAKPEPPELDFAPLRAAADSLRGCAARYDSARAEACRGSAAALGKVSLGAFNRALMDSERRLTAAAGLPGRPWFRHLVYAPGVYTGYGVKTLPGAREAIEQQRWGEAQTEIGRAAAVLTSEATLADSLARELFQVSE